MACLIKGRLECLAHRPGLAASNSTSSSRTELRRPLSASCLRCLSVGMSSHSHAARARAPGQSLSANSRVAKVLQWVPCSALSAVRSRGSPEPQQGQQQQVAGQAQHTAQQQPWGNPPHPQNPDRHAGFLHALSDLPSGCPTGLPACCQVALANSCSSALQALADPLSCLQAACLHQSGCQPRAGELTQAWAITWDICSPKPALPSASAQSVAGWL